MCSSDLGARAGRPARPAGARQPHVDWLGARHGHLSALAAAEVYRALGAVGNLGYHGVVAEPRHCAWREEWTAPTRAALRRHLLRLEADDLPILAAPGHEAVLDAHRDWTTPTLATPDPDEEARQR